MNLLINYIFGTPQRSGLSELTVEGSKLTAHINLFQDK